MTFSARYVKIPAALRLTVQIKGHKRPFKFRAAADGQVFAGGVDGSPGAYLKQT